MSELAVYLYPWDVVDAGAEPLVADLVARHVDRISVATVYHSAEYVQPRHRARYRVVDPNAAHLPLPPFQGELRARPGALAIDAAGLFGELAHQAATAGITMTGWAVGLHNSLLATAHPDAALIDCFGGRSGHALCPANPATQLYVRELVAGLASTGHFDELMVENLAYLLAPHGHPHELSGVPFDTPTRALLSLCFCDHCGAAAATDGVDAASLAEWVAGVLTSWWNGPAAGLVGGSSWRTSDELAGLIFARSDLAPFLATRCRVADELQRIAAEVAGAHGVALSTTGPGALRPTSLGFVEGLRPSGPAEEVARTMLLPYHADRGEVLRELAFTASVAEVARCQVLQTLWPTHHPGGCDDLLDKVTLARTLGYDQFGLYNYATATDETLRWIERVAEVVHDGR